MAINQISTSNTFGQWVVVTQALIERYNTFESTANDVYDTANSVSSIYSNTVNVYSNTVNVYTDIQNYVSEAYDTANAVFVSANSSANLINVTHNTANAAYLFANAAFEQANAALVAANSAEAIFVSSYDKANGAYDKANSAYNQANSANVLAQAAFDKANVGGGAVFKTISVAGQSDIVADSNTDTLTITAGTGVTITTDAANDEITISASGTGSTSATPNTLVLRDLSGDVYANNFISSSDIRLKDNIRPIENSLNIINNMRGVHFKWKNTGGEQIGLIAQEVEQVLPQVVFGEEPKSVNYAVIVSVLINAVNELTKRIEDLENNG